MNMMWRQFVRGSRCLGVIAAVALLCLLDRTSGYIVAAPGDLDPSFGTDGMVLVTESVTEPGSMETAEALVLQPDGKIVIVGKLSVARLLPNGSRDRQFGEAGIAVISNTLFPNRQDSNLRAVALQPDGKIIAVGDAPGGPTGQEFAVLRLTPTGAPDPSFGAGGLVLTDLGPFGGHDLASAVVIQPDGKILVAGSTYQQTGAGPGRKQDFGLVRYCSDGRLDDGANCGSPGFGAGGRVAVDFEARGDWPAAVALLDDGRIVVGGRSEAGGDQQDFAAARFTSTGQLDRSFGVDGQVRTSISGSDIARDMVVQPDGKIVIGGESRAPGSNPASTSRISLVRYCRDGRLDNGTNCGTPGFGSGGIVLTDVGMGAAAEAVAIAPDGKLVAAGYTWNIDFALVRYLPNGTLDATFGTNGVQKTDFGGTEEAFAVAVQPDGKIVAAGIGHGIRRNVGPRALLTRYLVASAAPPDELRVLAVSPTTGGDTGFVTLSVYGRNFKPGALVRLEGPASIKASAVSLVPDGRSLSALFDLSGKPRGLYDVVMTNSDGKSATLSQAFTIAAGQAPELWVDIVGSPGIRIGHGPGRYYIVYGNRGNVDGRAVPIWLTGIPTDAIVQVATADPASPPVSPVIQTGSEQQVALLVPVVPAGHTGVIPVSITAQSPSNFELGVEANPCIGDHISQGPGGDPVLSNELQQCSEAIAGALLTALDLAPGLGCGKELAKSIILAIAEETNDTYSGQDAGQPDWYGLPYTLFAGIEIFKAAAGDCLHSLDPTVSKLINATKVVLAGWKTIEKCKNFTLAIEGFRRLIRVGAAFDPNDKLGSQGAGSERYLAKGEWLAYVILFENKPTASAPARDVVITDQLDGTKVDLDTFGLGPVAFGNIVVVPPPGLSDYTRDVDLRPAKNLLVRITASLNKQTGLVTWRFATLDPITGLSPDDALAGFLPPNTTPPQGEGSVFFFVKPKAGLDTGSQIRNRARIVFDTNPPIDTPEWLNTIDNSLPSSQVLALPATQTTSSFEVRWSGTDSGAGILDYTIYVSEDDSPFTVWLPNTTATSDTFTGTPGKTYAFYSVTQDKAGNREAAPATADATTRVAADTTPPTTTAKPSPAPNAAGWNNGDVSVKLDAVDNPGGSSVKHITYSAGGAQTVPSTTVPGASATIAITAEGTTTLTFSAEDNAGNKEGAKTHTVNIDKTKPTLTGAPTTAPPTGGWYKADVIVAWTCSDNAGGSGIDGACPANSTVTGEGSNLSASASVSDKAGNTTAAAVSGIKIDRTAPAVSLKTDAAGYTVDQKVAMTCAATDALSGVATTTLTGAGAAATCQNASVAAYTLPLGSVTLTATATDKAGNTGKGTATVTVKVTYTSLCRLTNQFISVAALRVADGDCAQLDALAPTTLATPAAKAAALASYTDDVSKLVGAGALTPAQAATLLKLAQALAAA